MNPVTTRDAAKFEPKPLALVPFEHTLVAETAEEGLLLLMRSSSVFPLIVLFLLASICAFFSASARFLASSFAAFSFSLFAVDLKSARLPSIGTRRPSSLFLIVLTISSSSSERRGRNSL